MIKPVYFGKEDIDKVRLKHINKTISNFSEWVKLKIDEDIGIGKIGTVDNKDTNIELLIRKIINEELIHNRQIIREEKVYIEEEKQEDKLEIGGWTL